jgi:hypothetical protein
MADIRKIMKRAQRNVALDGCEKIVVDTTNFIEIVEQTAVALYKMNIESPCYFERGGEIVVIRQNMAGRTEDWLIKSQGALRVQLNRLDLFVSALGDDGFVGVPAPRDVVEDIYHDDCTTWALPLKAVKRAPFLAPEGLVRVPGYDAPSETYLLPGLSVDVPEAPTKEDTQKALRTLLDPFLDFPMDGLGRSNFEASLNGTGDAVPSLAALAALILQSFVREVITGPTAGYFFSKPTPGTGASLLVDCISTLVAGSPVAATTLPQHEEETKKTIFSLLNDGPEFINFDNINHNVDSGALASAMTAREVSQRVLGGSKQGTVPNRAAWLFSGNNVLVSGELLRRCAPIQLDAKKADPTRGRTFKYHQVQEYIAEHRAELVEAALTLVARWDSLGRPEWSGEPLASFEAWSRVMGGILDSVGMRGFLGNLSAWRADASDGADDDLLRLMDRLARRDCERGAHCPNQNENGERCKVYGPRPIGTVYRVKGTKRPRGVGEDVEVVSVMDTLNDMCADAASPDGPDPILLKKWGYDHDVSGTVVYPAISPIGRQFGSAAKRPYDLGDGVEFVLEERIDSQKTRYWVRIA